jgi:hypothetical protein
LFLNNHHQENQIKRKNDRHFIGNTLEKRRQPSLGNNHRRRQHIQRTSPKRSNQKKETTITGNTR